MRKVLPLLSVMFVGCGSTRMPQAHFVGRHVHTFVEHAEPGVLVVALGADGLPKEFIDVQLKIITKAARGGSVLVLATSSEQQARLDETCGQHGDLCARLHDGTVRVVIKPHQGPWVRDYGPFVSLGLNGAVFVIDAKYDDTRRRQGFEYRREEINEWRRALLEKKVELSNENALQLRAREETMLRYGAELAQLYKDEGDSRTRAMDDDAPFYIADAGFGNDRFELIHSPIFLDGGNLFVLEDGACLTTTDTIAKNAGDRILVEQELVSSFRCNKVIFLEALPGEGVIKHIDMFLMPVQKKTILIASFDPASMRFRERFDILDGERRALVVEAAIAMARNKLHLKQLGYDVIEVPSLFPHRSSGTVFFPTLLNGIIQVGRDGRRHLLLPAYETSNSDEIAVERVAKQFIHKAFGPDVDIQMIESTAPAQLQGALHCLTNMIPLSASLFAKDDEVARAVREQVSRYKPKLLQPSKDCLDQMLGEWRLSEVSRYQGDAPGTEQVAMVVEKTSLRLRGHGKEVWVPHAVSCVVQRPNEATLAFEGNNSPPIVMLRYERDGTLTVRYGNEYRYSFVRPAVLMNRVKRTLLFGLDLSDSQKKGAPNSDGKILDAGGVTR